MNMVIILFDNNFCLEALDIDCNNLWVSRLMGLFLRFKVCVCVCVCVCGGMEYFICVALVG
jgi:hypothetical protein